MAKKDKVEVLETEQIQEPIIADDRNVMLDFWNKYSKKITAFLIGLLIGVGAFLGYKHFIKGPKEIEAAEASYQAETLFGKMAGTSFSKDSVNTVLNGGTIDGVKIKGLLSIVKDFGGTNAGNRATYLVGATYMHTKEFEKAIKFLKDFDNKGAYQTEIKKQTMLGHCYAELKKNDEALAAYSKATSVNKKDDNFTADALMVAGAFAEKIGKTKEAIAFYTEARDEYPNFGAVQNGDVDKYLAKLGITK
jgi:tetratricopeptide (TPR) repeat protein